MKKIFTILGTTAVLGGAVLGLAACGSADNIKETIAVEETTTTEATTVETTETTVIEETAEDIVEETEKSDEVIVPTSNGVPENMEGSDI